MGHVSARMITRQHTEVKQSEQAHLEAFRGINCAQDPNLIRTGSAPHAKPPAPNPHFSTFVDPHQIRQFARGLQPCFGAYRGISGLTEGFSGLTECKMVRMDPHRFWCGC